MDEVNILTSLTHSTDESNWTYASVHPRFINARSIVMTWVTGTFINIYKESSSEEFHLVTIG